jgi:HPt (histidine-containing phosphotransfer) domain-containing protein
MEASGMSEGELDRLRRAVERLMSGQQEALGAIEQAVEEQETLEQETLAEVQDILSGAHEDARIILGIDEGGRGT